MNGERRRRSQGLFSDQLSFTVELSLCAPIDNVHKEGHKTETPTMMCSTRVIQRTPISKCLYGVRVQVLLSEYIHSRTTFYTRLIAL